jgi:hypothetical protein
VVKKAAPSGAAFFVYGYAGQFPASIDYYDSDPLQFKSKTPRNLNQNEKAKLTPMCLELFGSLRYIAEKKFIGERTRFVTPFLRLTE